MVEVFKQTIFFKPIFENPYLPKGGWFGDHALYDLIMKIIFKHVHEMGGRIWDIHLILLLFLLVSLDLFIWYQYWLFCILIYCFCVCMLSFCIINFDWYSFFIRLYMFLFVLTISLYLWAQMLNMLSLVF